VITCSVHPISIWCTKYFSYIHRTNSHLWGFTWTYRAYVLNFVPWLLSSSPLARLNTNCFLFSKSSWIISSVLNNWVRSFGSSTDTNFPYFRALLNIANEIETFFVQIWLGQQVRAYQPPPSNDSNFAMRLETEC